MAMDFSADPDLRDQVENLISVGKTTEAIQLLANTKHPHVELLRKKFDEAFEQFSNRLILFDEWLRTLSQINFILLELWPSVQQPSFNPVFKGRIEDLLRAEKLEEALNLMIERGYKDAILAKARFMIGQAHFVDKAQAEEWLILRNRIRFALMDMLHEGTGLQEVGHPPGKGTSPGGFWKSVRRWFRP